MTFTGILAAARSSPGDTELLQDLARAALAEGEEDSALVLVAPAAAATGNARLWQWTGLLFRSLDRLGDAMNAFDQAAAMSPGDAQIAHGRARAQLEAGLDARKLFETALSLEARADILLGWCAASFAAGDGAAALQRLGAALGVQPAWYEGHISWAQLAAMCGRAEDAMTTIDRALSVAPDDPNLWHTALRILTSAERFDEAWKIADRAIAATGDRRAFALVRAASLSDSGQLTAAAEAFAEAGAPKNVHHAVLLARQLIREGNYTGLSTLVERWMTGDDAALFWPYAAIAWRTAGDPRWDWLEGDERFVKVVDLSGKVDLGSLAIGLRQLHDRSGRYLDQSVRGGTQTDGPLLSRIDPEIQQLRRALVEAVEDYRLGLPQIDPQHPMLRFRRDQRVRFAGSWSVRLKGQGFHSQHVHPQGWISSAFYVDLPTSTTGREGWLDLGEPQSGLGSSLPPFRSVEPKAGQLVLFPSMMWHGTRPFPEGERLTVAFDVAPPK